MGKDHNKVFLSFRGSYARTGFTYHLYNRLVNAALCHSSCAETIKTSESVRSSGQSFSMLSRSLRSRYLLSLPIMLLINVAFVSSFKWRSAREAEDSLANVLQSRLLTLCGTWKGVLGRPSIHPKSISMRTMSSKGSEHFRQWVSQTDGNQKKSLMGMLLNFRWTLFTFFQQNLTRGERMTLNRYHNHPELLRVKPGQPM